jgi:hypothetical protein
VSGEPDPLTEAIRRADLAALWQAIEALPPQQRDALLLREFGGLSYGELAAALSVSARAVESLLFRARQRLRTSLKAAYASVAGAPWLETLARAFAGGGAPVAAKVAALGVGAAAVTGGAVVAPDVLERSPHRAPPPAAVRPPVRHVQAAATPLPRVQPASVVRPVEEPVTSKPADDRSGGDDGRGDTRAPAVRERSDGSDGAEPVGTESGGSGSGEPRDGEAAGLTLTVPAAPAATVTVDGVESRDGGGDEGHDGGDRGGD